MLHREKYLLQLSFVDGLKFPEIVLLPLGQGEAEE